MRRLFIDDDRVEPDRTGSKPDFSGFVRFLLNFLEPNFPFGETFFFFFFSFSFFFFKIFVVVVVVVVVVGPSSFPKRSAFVCRFVALTMR